MVALWAAHQKPLKSHWSKMITDSSSTEASKTTASGLMDLNPPRPTHHYECRTPKRNQ